MRLVLAIVIATASCIIGCKDKPAPRREEPPPVAPRDAATAPPDAGAWPELAGLPTVEPERVIAIPARLSLPRFTIGGPVLLDDLAVVSSSQFGFAAVDFRRGQLVWTRPAGSHVAPPIAIAGNLVLIGECINPPDVPAGETLLGCLRVVTPTGADQAYLAIRGKGVDAFHGSAGDQRVWEVNGGVVWRRGEAAVAIDLLSGVAKPHPAEDPPIVVTYKEKRWEVRRDDEGIISAKGQPPWKTERSYGPMLGAVYLPEQVPMIRVASPIMREGVSKILIGDMDATGSLHGQVTLHPVPGIGVTGHAISSVGDVAIAVRLDKSLQRDYIAGYAANALLIYTYALPQVPRPDPIGIAIAHDAVVVFHDGDTLTILPELSAPPTAPGAVRAPSENATP